MKNIILIGFMATGKTTTGRILAKLLGLKFFDSDEEIENIAGMTIGDIFEYKGEPYFRRLESEVIAALANNLDSVIATGGGVVLSDENMNILRSNGIIVSLEAKPEVILERIKKDGQRPLLNVENRLKAIKEILERRNGLYIGDLLIDTSYMNQEAVAIRIKAFINSEKRSLGSAFNFESGSCEVIYGSHIIDDLNTLLGPFYHEGKLLIISSPTVLRLWGSKLQRALKSNYHLNFCLIPDGEEYKNIDSLIKLYDKALEMNLDRSSLIIGFGGGVVGDIAGFAAATFMRGVLYIQIPTTLLSQADSSIGGKTAINHKNCKNLIGSFYQPKMVISDASLLVTLPPRELANGLAEVIKYGIISDYEFFEYMENEMDKILQLDQKHLSYIIQKSCSIKASIVEQDEKDHGLRMILNYGHTIGHAIEASTDYKVFRHGEAVSLGMAAAANIATQMGIINEDEEIRQNRLLFKAGLPIRFLGMDTEKVLSFMKNDKKSYEGHLRFVLPKSLGQGAVFENVPFDCIKAALHKID